MKRNRTATFFNDKIKEKEELRMTNINPFAFLLGYFLGGDSNTNRTINYEKIDIKYLEDILFQARYAQDKKSFNWIAPEIEKKMSSLEKRFANSHPSVSTTKAWNTIKNLAEVNSVTTDEYICLAEKILEK